MTVTVNSLRRHRLLKWKCAEATDDPNAQNWQAKHLAVSGTSLPVDFPGLATLATAGYTTVEDVNGADLDELKVAGLDHTTANDALAAIVDLI